MSEENENINDSINESSVNSMDSEVESTAIQKQNLSYLAKVLIIVVTVFLATFCAVYLAVDANMYKLGLTPLSVTAEQFDKLFDKEADFIEKSSPAPVKIDTKDDRYVVTISLKSFDDNPDNVEVETTSNGIKISGEFKKNDKNNSSEHSFYQNVIFPNKIDTNLIKKENKKSSIVITLPFSQNNIQDKAED
ncbi:MAG: Hsp20/alpha crystallin family protein [Candidatus Gastranaerophilaceae bacterium]